MKRFREVFRSESGFTLIELLVVIAVISVLAAIAVPRLTGVNEKAIQTEAVSFLGSVKTSLEMYYIENGNKYPSGNEVDLTSDDYLGQYIDNFNEVTDDWSFSYAYNENPGEDSYEITVTMKYKGSAKGINDVVLRKNDDGYEIITEED
ncbi:prepilin-type N-terminal cleavage/methylation domain-containing protein [Iocasia frigidifontis]|uniref:Prepilin-type N-terminal cleavage/methylation domain-containing protein n=1 Tax=Iocasia fonsfrigidae TaxID=2682810 RepID=A0A8A7KL29_9FIRM|nr:prepilin-type N-terminal cleavage/methylation domain-containing protein [Iocasia fonsfrigidae]QTL98552.1 prepilin-type N-terminal cleavage/methylation domain-containing protein [Iocasia fonsfrigidae]